MEMHAGFIEGCKEEYEKGNKFALMQVIYLCSCEKIPLPDWTAQGFTSAFNKVRIGEVKSWDDVFGNPHPKGKHLNAIKKRNSLIWPIYERVREIKNLEPSVPIDEHLFERIGNEFHISKTSVSDYYYEAKAINKKLGFAD